MSFEGKSQQEKWQMDGILKILKKQNSPRASSAPALELNTIIFKHVFWYKQQISGERLQDHWSSGFLAILGRGPRAFLIGKFSDVNPEFGKFSKYS